MNKNIKFQDIIRILNGFGSFTLIFSPITSIFFFILTLILSIIKINDSTDSFYNALYASIMIVFNIFFIIMLY